MFLTSSAIPSVKITKYGPRMRSTGNAITSANTAAARPDTGSANQIGRCSHTSTMLYVPSPKNTTWPSEMNPVSAENSAQALARAIHMSRLKPTPVR